MSNDDPTTVETSSESFNIEQQPTRNESEIDLQELNAFLMECAEIIRNRVDKTDYKEYILPLISYKVFHDTYHDNKTRALEKFKEQGIPPNKAEKRATSDAYHDFTIPEEWMWEDLLNQDTPARAVDDALRKLQEQNDQFSGLTGLDDYKDVEAFTKSDDNRLEALLRHLDQQNLSRYRVPPDMLGEAYMNLVKHFASEEGRDGGEFFTPPEIVELMVRLLEPYDKDTSIHDPTCGAGGMLVKVAEHLKKVQKGVDEAHWRSINFTGQELNETVRAVAEMNLAIHDVEGNVELGDSLSEPKFTAGTSQLEQFEYILANFPFSVSKWKSGAKTRQQQFGDLDWGDSLPHGNYGDFAFIMHMCSQLDDENGHMATVIPHGVLFRNGDQEYRQYLIENDMVEAVIGLPENLFEGTGIPSAILVLNNNKPPEREGEVMFFNADHEDRFYRDTGSDRSVLINSIPDGQLASEVDDPDGIAEIKQRYTEWGDEERVCRVVSNEEIAENEYNMNIALYVDTTEPQEDISVADTLSSIQGLESEYESLNTQLTTYMQQLNYESENDE